MYSIKYRCKSYLFGVCVSIKSAFPNGLHGHAYTHSNAQIHNSVSKMGNIFLAVQNKYTRERKEYCFKLQCGGNPHT